MMFYLCPALMDMVFFVVVFAAMYQIGQQGLGVVQCKWLAVLYQLSYMSASLAVGILISRRNARIILLAGAGLCAAGGAASLMLRDIFALRAAFCLLGIFMAFFFNAFQVIMRTEADEGNLERAVGFYTFSWSLGCGAGFLASGFVYRLGMPSLSALVIVLGALIFGILLKAKSRLPADFPDAQAESPAGKRTRRVDPIYLWTGWLMIFTAMFVLKPVHNFFPAICAAKGISARLASLPLFLQMTAQALTALFMAKWRHVFFRRTPLLLAHVCAAAIFSVMWLWPRLPVLFAGISLIGVYTGFIFFCSVYYASTFGRHGFNIGVNECLIGLGAIVGMFAAERTMNLINNEAGMYLVSAAALLASLSLQMAIVNRFFKKTLRRAWLRA